MAARALRGAAISFRADPFRVPAAEALQHWPDALLVIEAGEIASIAPWPGAAPAGLAVEHWPGALLCPGFIDAHVHYPQLPMVAAPGEELLGWLARYTFPAEAAFADPDHAARVARLFLRELLAAGTTSAAVYGTVHAASAEAFFAESARLNTRMIAGKVLMDRNAPPALLDPPGGGIAESAALIRRWHGKGRQLYAITPRFAPTSTPEQLAAAGRLWAEHPGSYMQTHLSESPAELDWVRQLFPEASDYLDVYRRAGLTGRRAIFGHGIHLSEGELCHCHASGSAIAHCPGSNLFLGSGLFRARQARREGREVALGLGSDIGAGTSLCALRNMGDAYKVSRLAGEPITAAQAFWMATRGGAEALALEGRIGSLEPGREADLVVLDLAATPLLGFRMGLCADLLERLFVLMTLGDERCVRATYVAGRKVYDREEESVLF
ncbi:guanine deaminase [Teichococcus cervicalis]|uniref:Guanine deaminase n=1 Tax=Pseudoroseomonas cervicalis ATCC 49957 TaxID=525371 RepID=D5RKX8_9PROT|nr:guanine deaminase [Pseudoroseomonas cervicalis]EFH12039.1 guanine deaminase [Pseudoroseomonas cervicalis ATCC 49957]